MIIESIGTGFEKSYPYFELTFPIYWSQGEQETFLANLRSNLKGSRSERKRTPVSGDVSFFQTRYVTLLSNISAAHRGSDNPKKRVSEEIPDKKGTLLRPKWENIPPRGDMWLVQDCSLTLPRRQQQRYLVKIRIQSHYSSSELHYLWSTSRYVALRQFTHWRF